MPRIERSLLPATRAWDQVLEWTWWSNLPHGPERDRRTGTDESFAVDSAGGRVRPVGRLVPDRGGGSGAAGRQHRPSAEHMWELRSAAGTARPRSRRELARARRQVPSLPQPDRHRADRDRAGQRCDLGAVRDPLPRRRRHRGAAGVPASSDPCSSRRAGSTCRSSDCHARSRSRVSCSVASR